MMKNKKLLYSLFIIGICMLALIGCSSSTTDAGQTNTNSNNTSTSQNQEQANGPTKLTLVSFLPGDHAFTIDMVPLWIEMIEKGTDGAVEIEWVGGPESIPVTEQFDAVRNGIVDIGFNNSAYFGNFVPEAFSLHLSTHTPWEERENGFYDYLAERIANQDVVYLGRWIGAVGFYFWSNKEISGLEDLNGLRFRSNPVYHELMVELGIAPTDVMPHEVYSSLERNLVEGFGFPILGPLQSGWTEVTKYLIDEPFLNQNATILINAKSLQSLPQDVQDKIMAITAEFEKEMYAYFEEEGKQEMQRLEEAGIQRITYSPEDSAKFQETVNQVMWKKLQDTAPDQVDKLKEILQ